MKYLKDTGIRHSTTKRERYAYKAEDPAGGLKFSRKDVLIKRAIAHNDPEDLATYACQAAVSRSIATCLYWYEGDNESFDDFFLRREISLEQGRTLVDYFKGRGVIATLHHLSAKGHLEEHLLPMLPRPKAKKPRKPRKPRTPKPGRRHFASLFAYV